MNDLYKSFKNALQEAGITQTNFCNSTFINKSTLLRLKDENSNPNKRTLEEIKKFFEQKHPAVYEKHLFKYFEEKKEINYFDWSKTHSSSFIYEDSTCDCCEEDSEYRFYLRNSIYKYTKEIFKSIKDKEFSVKLILCGKCTKRFFKSVLCSDLKELSAYLLYKNLDIKTTIGASEVTLKRIKGCNFTRISDDLAYRIYKNTIIEKRKETGWYKYIIDYIYKGIYFDIARQDICQFGLEMEFFFPEMIINDKAIDNLLHIFHEQEEKLHNSQRYAEFIENTTPLSQEELSIDFEEMSFREEVELMFQYDENWNFDICHTDVSIHKRGDEVSASVKAEIYFFFFFDEDSLFAQERALAEYYNHRSGVPLKCDIEIKEDSGMIFIDEQDLDEYYDS